MRCGWRCPATFPRRSRRPAGSWGRPTRCGRLRPPTELRTAATERAFAPDTDTRRPEVSDYDDPFTPSTAPFKRLEAFDAVLSDYHVEVRDPRLVRLPRCSGGAPPGRRRRRLLRRPRRRPPAGGERSHSERGSRRARRSRPARHRRRREVPFRSCATAPTTGSCSRRARRRGREPSARTAPARAARDGGRHRARRFRRPARRRELERAAARHSAPRQRRPRRGRRARRHRRQPRDAPARGPREAGRLLPRIHRLGRASRARAAACTSIWRSPRKGVCRHRAYAFLVTAQSLGIPTRLVENEAHAWVEVHDGTLWRRIDLGGAGRLPPVGLEPTRAARAVQGAGRRLPWPAGAERGSDMVSRRVPPLGGLGAGCTRQCCDPAPAPGRTRRAPARQRRRGGAPTTAGRFARRPVVPRPPRRASRIAAFPCTSGARFAPTARPARTWQSSFAPRGSSARASPLGTLATGDDGTFEGAVVAVGHAARRLRPLSRRRPATPAAGQGKN